MIFIPVYLRLKNIPTGASGITTLRQDYYLTMGKIDFFVGARRKNIRARHCDVTREKVPPVPEDFFPPVY